MALSPDGTLLYTMPDRLCGVDLYEPKGLKFGDKANPEAAQVFNGAAGPDQLVVADGRVLALSDNGQNVRVLSPDKGNEMSPSPLPTGATQGNVSLRTVGPRVYVISPHSICGYNLDHPDESSDFTPATPLPTIRDAFIGKRHLVLLRSTHGARRRSGRHHRKLPPACLRPLSASRANRGNPPARPDADHQPRCRHRSGWQAGRRRLLLTGASIARPIS